MIYEYEGKKYKIVAVGKYMDTQVFGDGDTTHSYIFDLDNKFEYDDHSGICEGEYFPDDGDILAILKIRPKITNECLEEMR